MQMTIPLDKVHVDAMQKAMTLNHCDKVEILAMNRYDIENPRDIEENFNFSELINSLKILSFCNVESNKDGDISLLTFTHKDGGNIFISTCKRGKMIDTLVFDVFKSKDFDGY